MKTFKKVVKRVVKDIIATRTSSADLRKVIEDFKSKLAAEQEKWKSLGDELNKARETVNNSQTQKESLAKMAKVLINFINT